MRSVLCHVHQQSHSLVLEHVAASCHVETTPASWSAMLSPVVVIINRLEKNVKYARNLVPSLDQRDVNMIALCLAIQEIVQAANRWLSFRVTVV